jgi:thiol-disulfide isomerase/thioredoxin
LGYEEWQSLIKSHEYGLMVEKGDSPSFILYRLTEIQKLKADSARAAYASTGGKYIPSNFFTTGEKISSFVAKDMEGNKYVLKDLKGKIIVLNFWFVNCPPCRMEIPELNKIVDKYKENNDVIFLAIALDEKYDIEEMLKKLPFKYHIIDGGRYITSKYGINSYPTHVIVDKEGVVKFHTSGLGPGTIKWIQNTIDALIKEN